MKSRILMFFFALMVWLGINWPVDWVKAACGIFVGFCVSVLVGDIFVGRTYLVRHPKRYAWMVYYILILFWEAIKGAVQIVIRLSRPEFIIKPGIVEVKTNISSATGISFLANSITIAMDTCVVDIDAERQILFVHWMNVESLSSKAATEMIVKKFEKILIRIFD